MPSLRQAVLAAFQDLVHQGRQFTGRQTYSERLSYLPKVTQSGRAEIGLWVGFVSPIFMAAATLTFSPLKCVTLE